MRSEEEIRERLEELEVEEREGEDGKTYLIIDEQEDRGEWVGLKWVLDSDNDIEGESRKIKRKDLLIEAEAEMDRINGEYGEEDGLCLFCGAKEYNVENGISHYDDCIVKKIREEVLCDE